MREAAKRCTSPTGFVGVPPPGPATPVTETAMSARELSESARRHRPRDLLAHRAVSFDQIRRHAEHLGLGVVGIGDEAALEHVRRAGHLGQHRRDQPAGAGFGRRELQARWRGRAPAAPPPRAPARRSRARSWRPRAGSTVAMAKAAMPSPRPVKPSPSLVVAFTPTRPASIPAISAMRARIALAVRRDLRPLADERHVEMDDAAAAFAHAAHRVGEEAVGRSALPLRVGGRKVLADIAVADRAEQRVGQRMEADIGVGMADEAPVVRDLDAAEPDGVARAEGMHVETLGRCASPSPREHPFRGVESPPASVSFMLPRWPSTTRTGRPASAATAASSVRSLLPAAAACAVRREQALERKSLRRLRGNEIFAGNSGGDRARRDALQRLGHGQAGDRAVRRVASGDDAVDDVAPARRAAPRRAPGRCPAARAASASSPFCTDCWRVAPPVTGGSSRARPAVASA